ncbi:hypothetical protein ACFSTI_05705 [Rhizorhabdus histidinilytica]
MFEFEFLVFFVLCRHVGADRAAPPLLFLAKLACDQLLEQVSRLEDFGVTPLDAGSIIEPAVEIVTPPAICLDL